MTAAPEHETGSRVRTVRMYDDAWNLIGARSRDRSTFIRDMTDAGLQGARCYRCFELVPVEFGDLTGKPLAEWVAEAQKTVTRQHKDGHHPIKVGGGAAVPAPAPAADDQPPGPTLVFQAPGAAPVATSPVPEPAGCRKARKR